jgi:hypothetical protein
MSPPSGLAGTVPDNFHKLNTPAVLTLWRLWTIVCVVANRGGSQLERPQVSSTRPIVTQVTGYVAQYDTGRENLVTYPVVAAVISSDGASCAMVLNSTGELVPAATHQPNPSWQFAGICPADWRAS